MFPDLRFRPLGRDEWQLLRNMRLNALSDSPQSFLANMIGKRSTARNAGRPNSTAATGLSANSAASLSA